MRTWRRSDRRVRAFMRAVSRLGRAGKLGHDLSSDELERPPGLHFPGSAEVDLQRRLELAKDVDVIPKLFDHVVRRPDQRLAITKHRLDGGPGDGVHHLVVARILARLMAYPRVDGLAENLDVALDARASALQRLAPCPGHVAVERALHLLASGCVPGLAPGRAVGADQIAHSLHAA